MSTCVSHSAISLFELQDEVLNEQSIRIPTWQRGDVWSADKKLQFKEVVMQKINAGGVQTLTGAVVIYSTEDGRKNNSPLQLQISDGLQRTFAAKQIFKDLANQYGEKQAKTLLKNIMVIRLDMLYKDEHEAKLEFIILNAGTGLTSYEQCETIMTDLEPYEQWTKKVFIPLHGIMTNGSARLGIKITTARDRLHKHNRDDLALFLRYLSEDQHLSDYKAGSKVKESAFINPNNDKLTETKFKNIAKTEGIDSIYKKLLDFKKFIEEETALFESVWGEIDKKQWASEKETVTDTNYRWCMAVAIYRKNKSLPRMAWRNFLKKFLEHTQGGTSIGSQRSSSAVSLSCLSRLRIVQEKIGVQLDPSIGCSKLRRKTNVTQIKSGKHNGHNISFAGFGDMSSSPQNGPDNLMQGVLPRATSILEA